jgi:sec-independent protein translocase protein TatA
MGGLAAWHWVVIAILVVILFGSKRLPDAARGLGRSLRIFKSEIKEMQSDEPAKSATPAPAQELPQPAPQQQFTPHDGDVHKSADPRSA